MSVELEGTIKIKVGDQEVEMSIEDAKQLSEQLNNLFTTPQVHWPYTSTGSDSIFIPSVLGDPNSTGTKPQVKTTITTGSDDLG